jgi:rubrerythrin
MSTPSLLDAIRIVKENERLAAESYANAARRMDSIGNKLFEQLSEFEQYHYVKLSELEKSLEERGDFINYEGKEFVLPPRLEVKFTRELGRISLLQIITEAQKIEKQAQNTYAELAPQMPDSRGRDMFLRLSEEEHKHYNILSEAYESLNQTGIWKWRG